MVTGIFSLIGPSSALVGLGCQTSLGTCTSFSSFTAKPLGVLNLRKPIRSAFLQRMLGFCEKKH